MPAPIPRDLPAVDRVAEAFRRIAAADRPEVWITLRGEIDVRADAAAVDARVAGGESLPLAGLLVAVKDNIDVAGLPTTAGCPEFAHTPGVTATSVRRLQDAGAVVMGKTNLDQFATGLVGTRSPYGAVRCAWDPELVSGGSSAGSGAAVGLGLVDLALGTDTAGSGRVPAAFHGIVGLKASLGLVSTAGVLPACADYDAVTVFAADLPTARAALGVMIGPDPADPRSRTWPADVVLGVPPVPVLAVPRTEDLAALTDDYRDAFDRTVARVRETGCTVVELDVSTMLDAARLLYDGAIVAERYSAVGAFLDGAPAGADPVVAGIIGRSRDVSGPAFADDLDTLAVARAAAHTVLAGVDGLLLPTTTEHPSIAAVQADPLAINRRMGTYTNFANLLDMAAMAVPGAPTRTGAPFGVMVVVPAFADQVALDLAALVTGDDPGPAVPTGGLELAVFGAHLPGQPLNDSLFHLGARYLGPARTTDAYRLVDLDTTPPKPGLVRHDPGVGAPIVGERYLLSPAALGTLLAGLSAPMSLTPVELDDGRWVTGFGCAFHAAQQGTDITGHGGWAAYRSSLTD
ncbi:allophanate hydrolase [Nakamurella flavida]|uniref:allophanate hydrolase n=1 Tax=Nakamurella flavida TaxID=363630 RepID=UPI001F071068|nr:allophanate hydrolase [Nakamurella flavida]